MKKSIGLLLFVAVMTASLSCSTVSSDPEEQFIYYMNRLDKVKLDELLTEDFVLSRSFADYRNDRASFLGEYLQSAKDVNGVFNIMERSGNTFVIEDQSDYFKYLDVDYPNWKLTVNTRKGKVYSAVIDTIENHYLFVREVKAKEIAFDTWRKKAYPNDVSATGFKGTALTMKRMKEYSGSH